MVHPAGKPSVRRGCQLDFRSFSLLEACVDTRCVARQRSGYHAWRPVEDLLGAFAPSAPQVHARRAHSRKVVAYTSPSGDGHSQPCSREALGGKVSGRAHVMLACPSCTSRAEARGSFCFRAKRPSLSMAPASLVGCGDGRKLGARPVSRASPP